MSSLFREEAVRAQQPTLLGAVRLATPVSQQAWGLLSAVTTAAIVAWLFLGHYTQREHVTGVLVPQAGLLNVTARSAGTIVRLNVTSGMQVQAGQVLLAISADRSSEAMGDTDAVIDAQLRSQESQTRATLQGLPLQVAVQSKDFSTRIAMLRGQITQTDSQLDLQSEEAASAMQLLARMGPLVQRGDVSTVEYDQYRDTALSDQASVKGLHSQRLGIEQQVSSLEAQLAQLPITTAATAHQLRGQLAQLDAQLAQSEVDRDSVVHAARAGTISSLLVKTGQAVSAGQPLLTILPQNAQLQAQLLVPSSAIGFVHKGTPVVLHYQAFPYQKFGVQHGVVAEVSRSALSSIDIQTLLGQQAPPTPLYRVLVSLQKQDIRAYGKRQVLLPGMSVDADLLLDHRRMIQWIFEPLYGMSK